MADNLGARLVKVGLVTRRMLAEALARAARTGSPLSVALVDAGLDDQALLGYFASTGFASVTADELAAVPDDVAAKAPSGALRALVAMPITSSSKGLVVAMTDPTDRHAVQELARLAGDAIVPCAARVSVLRAALEARAERLEGHGGTAPTSASTSASTSTSMSTSTSTSTSMSTSASTSMSEVSREGIRALAETPALKDRETADYDFLPPAPITPPPPSIPPPMPAIDDDTGERPVPLVRTRISRPIAVVETLDDPARSNRWSDIPEGPIAGSTAPPMAARVGAGRGTLRPPSTRTVPPSRSPDVSRSVVEIRNARRRDDVVRVACGAAATLCRGAAFFSVRGGVVQGHDAAGDGVSRDAVRNARIPVTSPGAIHEAIRDRASVERPYGDEDGDTVLRACLGSRGARIAVHPVLVGGKTVGLLCAEDPSFGTTGASGLDALAAAVASSFERFIRSGKKP